MTPLFTKTPGRCHAGDWGRHRLLTLAQLATFPRKSPQFPHVRQGQWPLLLLRRLPSQGHRAVESEFQPSRVHGRRSSSSFTSEGVFYRKEGLEREAEGQKLVQARRPEGTLKSGSPAGCKSSQVLPLLLVQTSLLARKQARVSRAGHGVLHPVSG